MIAALLVLFAMVMGEVLSQEFYGPAWEGAAAARKRSVLDPTIHNVTTPGSFPTIGIAELFLESMDTSFDWVGDDMPAQFPNRRPKLIHSVGAIADAKWTALPNPYTGVLASGCDNMYIRFSCAKAPQSGPKGYAPGISIKCLRDGVPSANMFAMYSLEGQDSWNFFKHDLTNHVPDLSATAGVVLQEIRKTFAKASEFPVMIGLSDFAHYDQKGVNTSTPKFPFRLIFHPTTAIHNAYPDAPSKTPFEYVIAQGLSQPTKIYEIYAQNQPTDASSAFLHIGSITTTSAATTSNFGDVYMFYQHTRFEKDLAIVPSWRQRALDIMALQQKTDYFTFPDLPFN